MKYTHKLQYKTFWVLALLLLYVPKAHAYLDPGTGSMLLAVIIGILSTLLFTLRSLWHRISARVFSSKKTDLTAVSKNVVCYSEGSQYWNTFSPLIEALHNAQVHCSYLSSDSDDPGLQYQSPYVHTLFVGKNNRAYTYLHFLEAKICVLTTPNLDTLQIKRSKGVSHYTHIIHAPTDIHLYKLFAFDFYDSIMTSGPHQEKSLRALEQLRNTSHKQIYQVGCSYMDVLLQKVQSTQAHTSSHPTILLAPTWGQSGLLSMYGDRILQPLVDSHYHVIVRPHPQSVLVEKDMIEALQSHYQDAKNIEWDMNPDNFSAMSKADVLISDRSGIIFDFAFVFEKPVITNQSQAVLMGMEGNDIPWKAWELEVLDVIGTTISQNDIQNLSSIVEEVLSNPTQYQEAIRSLRNSSLYNFGHTGKAAAEAVQQIALSL